ncbi:Transposase IS4 [Popillia japonica]|uniref:Transposase IS4 n=1 Tax=Popillia japonica TaxID=7064 RepID=A0AAW1MHI2_POPJA
MSYEKEQARLLKLRKDETNLESDDEHSSDGELDIIVANAKNDTNEQETQPDDPFRISNKPEDILLRLIEPISGSGRNITFDNWFTSYNLMIKLLGNHNLTYQGSGMVATIKSVEKEWSTIRPYTTQLLIHPISRRATVFLVSTCCVDMLRDLSLELRHKQPSNTHSLCDESCLWDTVPTCELIESPAKRDISKEPLIHAGNFYGGNGELICSDSEFKFKSPL